MFITEDKIKYEDVLLNKEFRKEAIEEIEGAENKARSMRALNNMKFTTITLLHSLRDH